MRPPVIRGLLAVLLLTAILGTGGAALGKDGNNGNDTHQNGETGNNGNNGNGDSPPATPPGRSDPPGRSQNESAPAPGKSQLPAGALTDQDQALGAVENNRAVPLETITARVEAAGQGHVIDAKLVTVRGYLLYELKVLEGDRLEVQYYYARSGVKVGE